MAVEENRERHIGDIKLTLPTFRKSENFERFLREISPKNPYKQPNSQCMLVDLFFSVNWSVSFARRKIRHILF